MSGHETQTQDDFQQFFERWNQQQRQHLQELVNAISTEQTSSASSFISPPPTNGTLSTDLNRLVQRVLQHYEEHYKAKAEWADRSVLRILSPPWTSTLEDTLRWIGGWRPTTAIQLLFSESGIQLEAKLGELIQGIITPHDLADLSAIQIRRVDELQRGVIREEQEITEKMAKEQGKAADGGMVELSHFVSKEIRREEAGIGDPRDRGAENIRVESTLNPKEKRLRKILEKADDLRMRTLKDIIGIASPTQAVYFLIAAVELQLRLHEWGKAKDERQLHGGGVGLSDTQQRQQPT